MKVLVGIKRVIDPYLKARVKADGSGVEMTNVKMTLNPFCEIAVEEAVRLKEAGHAEEVIVVSIGDESSQEQLRAALALGADRAIHVDLSSVVENAQNVLAVEPLTVAKILHRLMEQESVGLVLLGKQSVDSDNNQVPQMLAALSQRPCATFVSKVVVSGEQVNVTREVDGGLEELRLVLPAIISTDLRLNEPRYASLPNIMKAKKKPLDVITPQQLSIEVKSHQQLLTVNTPTERKAGERVANVDQLIEKLKNDAKVL
ncbi:electron transfer flavoprotein subunit beta/FixA family protein [Vibrio vulnificus]|nr:electron transfer flavoprotein subunit beta/FixA family protein [Vibrio vulnificus]